jgi:hypothetical protein
VLTHPLVELRDLNPRGVVGVAPEPNLVDLLSELSSGALAIRILALIITRRCQLRMPRIRPSR